MKQLTQAKWEKYIKQDVTLLIVGVLLLAISFLVHLGNAVFLTFLVGCGLTCISVFDLCRLTLKSTVAQETT